MLVNKEVDRILFFLNLVSAERDREGGRERDESERVCVREKERLHGRERAHESERRRERKRDRVRQRER